MAYDLNILQSQLQDLTRQYQQLANGQQITSFPTQQPQISPIQQVPIPVVARQVQYVDGIQGARLYQEKNLQPNSSEIIMDKNDNIFYCVSKDANGTPSRNIPIGRFTIEEQSEEPTYLTRKDFEDFKEEIRQLFTSNQKSVVLSSPAPSKSVKKEDKI